MFTLYDLIKPILWMIPPQVAHHGLMEILRYLDNNDLALDTLEGLHDRYFPHRSVTVGGVNLESPFVLAAGLVKGDGYDDDQDALLDAMMCKNIMPGWKSVPKLLGAVEFGSFTRHARNGNEGRVLWRDVSTRSLQNRIGLRNPGVLAVSEFLKLHQDDLPPIFGINIAPSPNVDDEVKDVVESLNFIESVDVSPKWYTLNLSCPNTNNDPQSQQTAEYAQKMCEAFMEKKHRDIPLWVKISPMLSSLQYEVLMRVFSETGVSAVIATNTVGSYRKDIDKIAGISGGTLHQHALDTVRELQQQRWKHDYNVDIIGCGGVNNGQSYMDFVNQGVKAVQYWSALIYRGPFAAAHIQNEMDHL